MIPKNLIRPLRWLRRFRKRRGYGIHSPAAFQFVTGVIYEKGTYYAYETLREERNAMHLSSREKDDRLLFRLVNYHHPSFMVALGEGKEFDMACRYMKAARRCPLSQVSPSAKMQGKLPQADFYYLDAPKWDTFLPQLLAHLADGTFIIVRNPHGNTHSLEAWHKLCNDPRVRQSYDLYDFGICQCEARLNKEHFTINYY